MRRRKSAAERIGTSIGWDVDDVRDCRYQNYVSPAVYDCSGSYFAVRRSKPRHAVNEHPWEPYSDQLGACDSHDLIIWECKQ